MPYAEGILLTAYRNIPVNHNYFNRSYASDDAVTNLSTSNIKTVVSGGWTSSSNPFSVWNTAYESIFYTNTFLEEMKASGVISPISWKYLLEFIKFGFRLD